MIWRKKFVAAAHWQQFMKMRPAPKRKRLLDRTAPTTAQVWDTRQPPCPMRPRTRHRAAPTSSRCESTCIAEIRECAKPPRRRLGKPSPPARLPHTSELEASCPPASERKTRRTRHLPSSPAPSSPYGRPPSSPYPSYDHPRPPCIHRHRTFVAQAKRRIELHPSNR